MLFDFLADQCFANSIVPHIPSVDAVPCRRDLSLGLRLHRLGQVYIEPKEEPISQVLLDLLEEGLCLDLYLLLRSERNKFNVFDLVDKPGHIPGCDCLEAHHFVHVLDDDKKV